MMLGTMAVPVFAADGEVAQIGNNKYTSLEAAFAAAQDGETITVLADCTGNGIKALKDKFASGLTVDFDNHTYTVDGETVGSTGTETNGFQLLKGNTITFKNGTITSEKAKILVQNYSNLTLDGMTLDGTNLPGAGRYVLSNNNGDTVITGKTNIIAKSGDFAFDCFFWSKKGYNSVSVTVDGNMTGTINGNIEFAAAAKSDAPETADNHKLFINGGVINGEVVTNSNNGTVAINTPAYKAAKVGDKFYGTLEAAFAAANDGETVKVLKDCAGNGIKAQKGKYTNGLTVDFGGHTYTVDGETVGSAGTETNGFQLLKDNTITFKNGTITSAKAKILVQNYSNLTLDGMTLDGSDLIYDKPNYTLSNNNGNVTINNSTITAKSDGFAFDVCRFSSYPSVHVTVTGNSQINGDIEVDAGKGDAKEGFSLNFESGNFTGTINPTQDAKTAMTNTPDKASIKISGGTFSTDPQAYVAQGYAAVPSDDVYNVKAVANLDQSQMLSALASATSDAPVTIKSAVKDNVYEQVTGTTVSAGTSKTFTITSSETDFGKKTVELTKIIGDTKFTVDTNVLCGLIITGIPETVTVTVTTAE